MNNPKTHSIIIDKLGVELYVNQSHDNIFVVRKLTDKTEHGNIGLYAIYGYHPWYGYDYQYEVPLKGLSDRAHEWELFDELSEVYAKFCELKGIKKHPRNATRTKYNPKKADIGMFLEFAKKEIDG